MATIFTEKGFKPWQNGETSNTSNYIVNLNSGSTNQQIVLLHVNGFNHTDNTTLYLAAYASQSGLGTQHAMSAKTQTTGTNSSMSSTNTTAVALNYYYMGSTYAEPWRYWLLINPNYDTGTFTTRPRITVWGGHTNTSNYQHVIQSEAQTNNNLNIESLKFYAASGNISIKMRIHQLLSWD